jgi:allantoicase
MSDFTDHFDLASLRLGASVVAASDDFFAEKENLLLPHPAVWKEHEYTDRGKWMDGWESRRKRTPGYTSGPGTTWNDWAIVRLGVPGIVRGVDVDTSFFRGNYPESCSIEACAAPIDAPLEVLLADETEWVEILPRKTLEGNSKNRFAIDCPYAFTHLRLRIFPDGGVARLRVHGDVAPDWRRIGHARGEIDLAAVEHGGDVLLASDMFFGERRNLVMPGRAKNMSDGWETRRRRGPGSDWAIVRLGAPGSISRVEIDTNHFKGNFPDTCKLEACFAPGASAEDLAKPDAPWRELLATVKLQAHTRHYYESELAALGPATHVRINVYPDGGVSRLRVHGTLDDDARRALGVRRLDTLPPRQAEKELHACAAASRWSRAMAEARPFGSWDAVVREAERAWKTLGPDDFREAMAAHPRIGEKKAEIARSATEEAWSRREQSGMSATSDATRAKMAEMNRAYEARFGFTYIVCATGKSAEELVAIAERRLSNEPEAELAVAGAELFAIANLRLAKLCEP